MTAMSAYSVNRLRQVEAPPVAPKPDERSGASETLRRLAAEPTVPGVFARSSSPAWSGRSNSR